MLLSLNMRVLIVFRYSSHSKLNEWIEESRTDMSISVLLSWTSSSRWTISHSFHALLHVGREATCFPFITIHETS